MALSSHPPRDNETSQTKIPFIAEEEQAMTQTYNPNIDSVIYDEVMSLVSCTLDELAQRLPGYSWAQVFAAVDRLSRRGTLRLGRTGRFSYVLSVSPIPLGPDRHEPGGARSGVDGMGDSILATR
jgi:hypothetical protein